MEYLYHYTSVDVLELILSNRRLRFSPLYKMDDWQEKYSAHGPALGRHYFISSWTESENEIKKMWRDYCKPDPSRGVRIRLPVNPFSRLENNLLWPVPSEMMLLKAQYDEIISSIVSHFPEAKKEMFPPYNSFGSSNQMENLNKYKNMLRQRYPKEAERLNKLGEEFQRNHTIGIPAEVDRLLCKVTYTNDEDKIFPRVYGEYKGEMFGDFSAFGEFKEERWAWQEEWRYIIQFARMRAFKRKADGTIMWYDVPFDHYDLIIDRDKLKQIEITLSPVITDEAKSKVFDCVTRYVPSANVNHSGLDGVNE